MSNSNSSSNNEHAHAHDTHTQHSHPQTDATSSPEAEIFELVDSIHYPKVKLAIRVDQRSTKRQVLTNLDRVGECLARHEAHGARLKQLLGRVLAIVQDREMYTPEYDSFEQFRLAFADRLRLSRATVSECLTMVRAFERAGIEVDPKRAENIPSTSLALVARASRGLSKPKIERLLDEAAQSPVSEFRRKLEDRGMISRASEQTGVLVSFRTTKRIASALSKYVGDEDWGEMLYALLSATAPARKPVRRSNTRTGARPAAAKAA